MGQFLPKFIDDFLRHHPVLMSLCILIAALIACVAMIAARQNRLVYEGF